MIDIKDISGKIIKSVLITQECKEFDALMELCYIELSWSDTEGISLPAGSSIEWNGKLYSLLEPYFPDIHNEAEYKYSPKFYDDIASWSKQPFFWVTENGEETDWSLTAYPGQFLDAVVRALKKYVGKTYTYSIDASIAESRMENIVFQNSSIFEGLTKIADTWETEWWVEGDIIHISKCQYGNPVTLEVGYNIGVPTITKNKEGYYTRFYAFGSTRNITQDYNDSGFTNGIVNKRLTLNTSKYPGGYIDIRPNLKSGEIFVKTLIFEDIYPSSELIISGLTPDIKNVKDNNGNDVEIGKDESGNPIYDKYTIWSFKLAGFEFNNSTYDPVSNPRGMLISGLELSISFESGQLNGRNFKLTYHEGSKMFEINPVTEGSLIIPGTVSLIPAEGDKVILYNIKMPDEYTTSAQTKLAEALQSEIDKRKEDRDTYNFQSYPVVFKNDNLNLNVGQTVTLKNGSKTLSTRIQKVEKQMDCPFKQSITIGEEKIKGTTQELKEEVVNANQSIDAVKALSDLNKAITDGYWRVQQAIIESISKYQGLWLLDKNGYPNNPDNWLVRTDYSVLGKKDIVAYATSDHDIVLPHAGYNMVGAVQIKPDSGLIIDSATGLLSVDPDFAGGGGGIDFTVGSGIQLSAQKILSVKYGVAADTVAAGNDSRIINGQKAFEVISKGTWWGQKMNAEGVVTGAMTGVTNINGKLSFVDTGVDVTDNIRATGDVVAYATGSGDISDWLGLVIDNDTIRFNSAGKLYVAGGASQAGIAGISVAGSGNAITAVSLSADKTSLTFTKGSIFALKSEIPTNTNQLTNGAGFITGINQTMILNALTGAGSSSKYLAGNGTFYTISYSELSGTPDLSLFVRKAGDTMTGALNIQYANESILKVIMGSDSNRWSSFSTISNAGFSGAIKSSQKFMILAGNNYSNRIEIDGGNISATGDVVAYSTGAAPSPFKYWYPYVDTSGNLSWSNSTSETTPPTRNIKGPAGANGINGSNGQGVTYGWSGTSLRLGTISSSGTTSWGSYVNLQGPQGPAGAKGATGATGPQGPRGATGAAGPSFTGGSISSVINKTTTGQAFALPVSGGWALGCSTSEAWVQAYGNASFCVYCAGYKQIWINTGSYTRSAWIVSSDMREKTRLSDFINILEKVKNIDVFRYRRKDNDLKEYIGVSAQQLLSIFPNFVSYDNSSDRYGVTYDMLGACVAIQGLKEMMKLIEGQKKEIDELRKQLNNQAA